MDIMYWWENWWRGYNRLLLSVWVDGAGGSCPDDSPDMSAGFFVVVTATNRLRALWVGVNTVELPEEEEEEEPASFVSEDWTCSTKWEGTWIRCSPTGACKNMVFVNVLDYLDCTWIVDFSRSNNSGWIYFWLRRRMFWSFNGQISEHALWSLVFTEIAYQHVIFVV